MEISNLYDLQLLMFVFIIPCGAVILIVIFGLLGVLLEVFKEKKPQTAKFIVMIAGCILIAWIVYTWKTGERTEANRELINRLERDYRILDSEVDDIKRKVGR